MTGFDLVQHLSRSAEVSAFDLTAHLKPRQTINLVRTTCALKRRPLDEARTFQTKGRNNGR
jgi:hypothetical protein